MRNPIRIVLVSLAAAATLGGCSSSSSSSTPSPEASTGGSSSKTTSDGGGRGDSAASSQASSGASSSSESASSDAGVHEAGQMSDATHSDTGAKVDSGLCAPANVVLTGPSLVPTDGISPLAVTAADLNKDGIVDLISQDSSNAGVNLGVAGGTFAATTVVVGGSGQNIVASDLDGDGYLDLVAFQNGEGNIATFSYAHNNGASAPGTFGEFTTLTSVSDQLIMGAVGDFNGDGAPDLASIGDTLDVTLNSGNGTFSAPTTYSDTNGNVFGGTGDSGESIATADIDGDGNVDIVVASNANAESDDATVGGVCVFYNTGHGSSFSAPVCYPPAATVNSDFDAFGMALGDFNGDGAIDVALGGGPNPTYDIYINTKNGQQTGSFKAPVALTTKANQEANSMIAADLNDDGKLDLVGVYAFGGISVSLGNGDGTFSASSLAYGVGNGANYEGAAAGKFGTSGLTGLAVSNNSIMPADAAAAGGIQLLLAKCL